jgi:hypothetical protein
MVAEMQEVVVEGLLVTARIYYDTSLGQPNLPSICSTPVFAAQKASRAMRISLSIALLVLALIHEPIVATIRNWKYCKLRI